MRTPDPWPCSRCEQEGVIDATNDYSERNLMLEIEAALATFHPHEDWIRNVATRFVWGSRVSKDFIGLMDECERAVVLWYHKDRLSVSKIDPDSLSGRSGRHTERFEPRTREEIPGFIKKHRERFG